MKKALLFRLAVLVAAMMCALGAAAVEAYTCYTSSNATLTFYYDDLRSTRPGTTYNLNTGNNDTDWETDGTNDNVSKVVFDPSFADARPTTTYAWFYEMVNLQSIQGLRYLNTSQVTEMSWMFGYCTSLTAIDVGSFNTAKVINMVGVFASCWNLQGLDLTSFNTSKVKDMYGMFNDCGSLKTIYVLDGWTTAAVTRSTDMFSGCVSLVGGQGTTYNESNPKDKTYAHIDGYNYGPGYFTIPINNEAYACYTYDNTLSFYYDRIRSFRSTLTYDLNTGATNVPWDTDGTNTDVTQVVIDPSFADARPTSTYDWFFGMENLQSIQGLRHLNTNMVTNMGWMFSGCEQLNAIDLSGFLTSRVTDMSFMFWGCTNLKSLDLTSFNTAKVTKMPSMFYYCNHLETIIVGDDWSTAAVTDSEDMFYNCASLVGGQGTTYDASHVDKAYAHLDYGTSNPGYFTAQLEAYVMYNGSAMALTFYYDNQRKYRLGKTYDLNWSTTDPEWITNSPGRVNHVVFDPSFAGARPSSTWRWFANMYTLQDVTGMKYLNTSKVGYMGHMFYNCIRLTALDLSNFNTAEVVRTDYMFYNCNNLRTIFGGDGWNTNRVALSTSMFSGCTSLAGDQGTTFNESNPTNKTYAHLDGGTSNPGYFSRFKEAYACYTPSNTTLTFYYDNQRSSRSGRNYDLNTTSSPGWDTDGTNANVTKVVFNPSFAGTYPTSTFGWFSSMTNLQSITGMEYLNTEFVYNMGYMFCRCSKLTSIDLSHFNTSRVVELDYMFYKCSQLTVLDLSSFNTPIVAYMNLMFADCSNLTTIYAGEGWTTSVVEYADYMFRNCTSLVGGQGTHYNVNHIDKTYAHIDGGPSNPGYFTAKNAGLRGDVNGDGSVNISDVTALIDLLLGGGSISNPAADCNQDSSVNISDVTALIDYLLSNHW